ncbi:unnamed protein product [Cyprideis torosa]|uniref:Uncharacterized protein n=1 Tax=Cyprideis torosa TaxID=163714 RepID=A0A7R8W9A3_9CRUS|nr:unnamed protein product [Cyprideis torosa]CAG0889543.1 unnamed protein product [Cyprideis torosa]
MDMSDPVISDTSKIPDASPVRYDLHTGHRTEPQNTGLSGANTGLNVLHPQHKPKDTRVETAFTSGRKGVAQGKGWLELNTVAWDGKRQPTFKSTPALGRSFF